MVKSYSGNQAFGVYERLYDVSFQKRGVSAFVKIWVVSLLRFLDSGLWVSLFA